MNADAFFAIGSTHPICQDYALANVVDDMAYAIIADGCSTGVETDWGARLLVKSAELALKNGDENRPEIIMQVADSHRRGLGLPVDSMLATLGMVILRKDAKEFLTALYADGYVVARRRGDKSIVVFAVNYTSGAPYYLRYNFIPGDKEQYLERLGYGKFEITTHDLATDVVEKQELPLEDGMKGVFYAFDRKEFDLVAVITDGLDHFINKIKGESSITKVGVPDTTILKEIMDIKGYAGTFMKRRCYKAFEKFKGLNYINEDDFGIGVVYDG